MHAFLIKRPAAAGAAAADEGSGPSTSSAAGAAAGAQRIRLSADSWVDQWRLAGSSDPQGLVPGPGSPEFEELWRLRPPHLGTVRMMGRAMQTPRYQQSYGRAYSFTGITLHGGPVPPLLQRYVDWANSLPQYGQKFDEILLNWYQDGNHYISAHSDDETQLEPGQPIISLSLGATRTFRITGKAGDLKNVKRDISLPHGACLVMGGRMQQEFKHEVTKLSGDKAKLCGRRINITLRAFKPEDQGGAARPAKRQRTKAQ